MRGILIVDDDPIQLRTGRRVLVRLGYKVKVVDSGLGACELFGRAAASSAQSPFDLIIIDMLLGESLDGLQVIDNVRRSFPAQKAVVREQDGPPRRSAPRSHRGRHLARQALYARGPRRDRRGRPQADDRAPAPRRLKPAGWRPDLSG